jgi:uncharacterized protein (TIGR02147 family)
MNQSNYRDLLRFELSRRQSKNPAYSLRAFARDLELSPSRLSEILKGEKISAHKARAMMQHLPWNSGDKRRFELLVATEGSDRKLAQAASRELESDRRQAMLDHEAFKVIGDWMHTTVLALFDIKTFKSDLGWIAGKLKCSEDQAGGILGRLKKFGLIEGTKKTLRKTKARLTISSGVPSEFIRSYHEQLVAKAERSINEQSVNQRCLQSLVFAMDRDRLPEAFQRLEAFVKEFNQEFSADQNKTTVMALTAQLFTLVDGDQ